MPVSRILVNSFIVIRTSMMMIIVIMVMPMVMMVVGQNTKWTW